MTFTTLRLALALATVAIVAQTAPCADLSSSLDSTGAIGDTLPTGCSPSVNSGEVSLGSVVNTSPVTNVNPINRYQPIVHAFAPIVQSECDTDGSSFTGSSGYSGASDFYRGSTLGDSGVGSLYSSSSIDASSSLYKRVLFKALGSGGISGGTDDMSSDYAQEMNQQDQNDDQNQEYQGGSQYEGSGDQYNSSNQDSFGQSQQCQGGEQSYSYGQGQLYGGDDQECNTSLPSSTVALGSDVSAMPLTTVNPATYYQPQVQSLESNIEASPAQSISLPQQNVNLASNVAIQPTTHVLPQTTYQPEVHQLTTDVQAAPEENQSLPQSSVQLGSSVQITPKVSVQPLTVFQPTVQALPFAIDVAPCPEEGQFQRGSGGDSAGYPYARYYGPGMSSLASSVSYYGRGYDSSAGPLGYYGSGASSSRSSSGYGCGYGSGVGTLGSDY